MLGIALNIGLTVVAVSLIILVHEFGHFIMAKLVGMRVEIFSIGFWKRLVGVKIGTTDYRISAVPLGGYVKVTGEATAEGEGEPHEFWSKTPGQRALFVLGGAGMNLVLAVVFFIFAYTLGVPYVVAEVGSTERGSSAWEAGLRPRDEILEINGTPDPVFHDIQHHAALAGGDEVRLLVDRDGERIRFRLEPRYDEQVGFRRIGVAAPVTTVVSDLRHLAGEQTPAPAREAGIQLLDRIIALDGAPVQTARDVQLQLLRSRPGPIDVLVERVGERMTFTVEAELVPRGMIGISGVGTTIEALQGEGVADRIGLEVGDRITAVNGRPVRGWSDIHRIALELPPALDLEVARGDERLALRLPLADAAALRLFEESVVLSSDNVMTWVQEGGPAWEAGLRPGDQIVRVAGREVETWEDVHREGGRAEMEPREIQWTRDGELFSATVTPRMDTAFSSVGLGIGLGRPKTEERRYRATAAVAKGFKDTYRTLEEIVLSLRGFATGDVSPRNMGGIVMIAQASYQTVAVFGIRKLLHLTAMISLAVGALQVLPIPVLDGGHLLFLLIEKVRGRRLTERAMTIAQTVGLVLLLALIIYVTHNDIMRLIRLPG